MNRVARQDRRLRAAVWLVSAAILSLGAGPGSDAPTHQGTSILPLPSASGSGSVFGSGAGSESSIFRTEGPVAQEAAPGQPSGSAQPPGAASKPMSLDPRETLRNVPIWGVYALFWLAPGAVMVTAFVRINIVLVLLRQAVGSPQVPGNQIVTAVGLSVQSTDLMRFTPDGQLDNAANDHQDPFGPSGSGGPGGVEKVTSSEFGMFGQDE